MSTRNKRRTDFQFMFGDTLTKTGTALIWFAGLLVLFRPEIWQGALAGDVLPGALIGGVLIVAFGLWQWGRGVRQEATIADR
jgi:ABC-type nickel/cobalt efflux system permease component RcnA